MDNTLAFFHRRLTTIPDRDSFLNKVQEMLPFLTYIYIKLIFLTTSQGCYGEAKLSSLTSRKVVHNQANANDIIDAD